MNYNDLIGKVTRWGITRVDGKDEPEPVRYLITDVDGDGMLVGVCLNEEPALRGLIRTGMDPERVRRGLGQVISLEAELAKGRSAHKPRMTGCTTFAVERNQHHGSEDKSIQ